MYHTQREPLETSEKVDLHTYANTRTSPRFQDTCVLPMHQHRGGGDTCLQYVGRVQTSYYRPCLSTAPGGRPRENVVLGS
jgi:hypothetical protein